MSHFLHILWNPDLTIGPIRWYSLCWLIGLVLAYFIVRKLYKDQKLGDDKIEPLFFYCFIGILLGARLGHCIFYQPQDYLTSWQGIVEMILPIQLGNDGSWLGETFGFFFTGKRSDLRRLRFKQRQVVCFIIGNSHIDSFPFP